MRKINNVERKSDSNYSFLNTDIFAENIVKFLTINYVRFCAQKTISHHLEIEIVNKRKEKLLR